MLTKLWIILIAFITLFVTILVLNLNDLDQQTRAHERFIANIIVRYADYEVIYIDRNQQLKQTRNQREYFNALQSFK